MFYCTDMTAGGQKNQYGFHAFIIVNLYQIHWLISYYLLKIHMYILPKIITAPNKIKCKIRMKTQCKKGSNKIQILRGTPNTTRGGKWNKKIVCPSQKDKRNIIYWNSIPEFWYHQREDTFPSLLPNWLQIAVKHTGSHSQ